MGQNKLKASSKQKQTINRQWKSPIGNQKSAIGNAFGPA